MYQYMYDYYREQEVLPTYGSFQSADDLAAHELARRNLFVEKLFLPPRVFKGARLIEFGPDAGENSLVFAQWGASCTLVEPNRKAHAVIENYFERFDFGDRLAEINQSDVQTFANLPSPPGNFDFVDAEGFIYTVKPDSLWIDLFSRILNDDGFVILFYCEAFGSFLELFLKVIHARFRGLTGAPPMKAAQELYLSKWNSIPHKRSMQSWVMDVLENPFVRLGYFLEPRLLCRKMARAGLSLYSSWPSYNDGAAVHWFKKELSAEDRLRAQEETIARSRLSHLFGRKHCLLHARPEIDRTLWNLVTLTDELIDEFDSVRALHCVELLSVTAGLLDSDGISGEPKDIARSRETIRSAQQILNLLVRGKVEELQTFCNTDQAFIESWGMPSHFAVFRKSPGFGAGNGRKVTA